MANILVLHGPNLNLLGQREAQYYGNASLSELDSRLVSQATAAGHNLITKQSNAEHELIDYIQQALSQNVAWIIFNPAAFTHTSIALRDALLAVNVPFVEVHLSNIFAREEFRQHSYFSDIAQGVICGFGTESYCLALEFVCRKLI